MGLLSNISLSRYLKILEAFGWAYDHTTGGHQIWTKVGKLRNIVVQSHIDPIPEMVVHKNLKTMDVSRKEFEGMMKKIK